MQIVYYTAEQIEYLRLIAPGKPIEDVRQLFNQKFNESRSKRSISGVMSRNGIKTGMQGYQTRFKKGDKAWNKGTKGLYLGGESGWFKKGHLSPSYLPVGSESVKHGDWVIVKVADPDVWKLKHHYLYEQHFGEIPENHVVIFADRNKRNFDLDNLLLVERTVVTAAAKRGLLFENIESTKSGILLAKLMMAVNKKGCQ